MIFKKLNRKGFTLIEVLISFGILSVAGYYAFNTIKQKEDFSRKATDTPRVYNVNESLLAGMKRLLMNVKGENPLGPNKEGICKFMKVAENPSGNVRHLNNVLSAISLTVPKRNGGTAPFSDEEWNAAVDGWEITSNSSRPECRQTHNWKKCFKLTDLSGLDFSEGRTEKMDVLAVGEVIPVFINPKPKSPNDGTLFRATNPREFDSGSDIMTPISDAMLGQEFSAKDIAFILVSTVYFNSTTGNDENRQKKVYQQFIWPGDIEYCNDANSSLRLAPSGSGLGDADGATRYNIPGFRGVPEVEPPPVYLNFVEMQVTEGAYYEGAITTNIEKNLAGACNEIKYTCPGDADVLREYGPTTMKVSVEYNNPNSLFPFGTEEVQFNVDFRMSRGAEMTPMFSSMVGDAAIDSFITRTDESDPEEGRLYTEQGGKLAAEDDGSPLRISSVHNFDVRITDAGTPEYANNMCRQVCNSGTNYNYPLNSDPPYRIFARYNFPDRADGEGTQTKGSPSRFGCNACFMKNCSRLGLGTFGNMHEQPAEPMDTNTPECELKKTGVGGSNRNLVTKLKALNFSNMQMDNPTCLKYNPSTNQYQTESCAAELPVLCFNWGAHLIALNNAMGAQPSINRQNFYNAAKACFNQARTGVIQDQMQKYYDARANVTLPPERASALQDSRQNLSELQPGNSGSWGNTPSLNSNVSGSPVLEFVNLAQQGTFIGPQSSRQLGVMRRRIPDDLINQWVWAPFRVDSRGAVYSSPPRMTAHLQDDQNYAMYFTNVPDVLGGWNDIRIKKIPISSTTLNTQPNSLPTAPEAIKNKLGMALFNHIKYKGAVGVNPVSPGGFSGGAGGLGVGGTANLNLRYICRTATGDIVISASTGSRLQDGPSKCPAGSYFVPPTTPLGWAKAMDLIQRQSSLYGFTDPDQTAVGDIQGAWVAMTQESEDQPWLLYDNAGYYSGLLSGTKPSGPMLCINQFGAYRQCSRKEERTNEEGEVEEETIGEGPEANHVICLNRSTGKMDLKCGDSCNSGTVRVTEKYLINDKDNLVYKIAWLMGVKNTTATLCGGGSGSASGDANGSANGGTENNGDPEGPAGGLSGVWGDGEGSLLGEGEGEGELIGSVTGQSGSGSAEGEGEAGAGGSGGAGANESGAGAGGGSGASGSGSGSAEAETGEVLINITENQS